MQSKFVETNHIRLHYLDWENDGKPLLLLLHGLTANAHAFDGLVSHGLAEHVHLITPDLRGRGLSDKPAFHYNFQDHANDIVGLMDALKIEKLIMGGHSYGGLLSAYIASNYPERVEKLILLDAASKMNDNVLEMLSPTLSRLDKTFKSYDDYIQDMKAAPQNTFWDKDMDSYYKADANIRADGTVNPYPNLANIIEVATDTGRQDWEEIFTSIGQHAILVNGQDIYTLGEPLLPEIRAEETVQMMKHCKLIKVDGNHQTMLYGDGAKEIVKAITNFLQ